MLRSALEPGYIESLLDSDPEPETCHLCGYPLPEGHGVREDIYVMEELAGFHLYHQDCYGIVWEDCDGDRR